MTEKLYYNDPFCKTFTATVRACVQEKDAWAVTLDRTVFYPEGGGQPADHGTLGGVHVADTRERDGEVVHLCSGPLAVGEAVEGAIDWARRFDFMQQHSGEHIVSGILCGIFHCDNVGFHIGHGLVTIDFNAELTPEDVLDIERRANQYIWEDHALSVAYPSPEELEKLDYRSKKALAGQVRIVSWPGADCCACCGTHVLRSGQVGLVKLLSCQKFREGVRLEILCGKRALDYLSAVYDQARSIAQGLSVKPRDAAAAVERLEAELAAAKAAQAHLEETAFHAIAKEHAGRGDVLLFQPPMRPDSVRRLADAAAQKCGGLSAVFAGEDGQFAYALVRADGADISALVKSLNQTLRGRGGGRNGFAQGSVQAGRGEIQSFFAGQGGGD